MNHYTLTELGLIEIDPNSVFELDLNEDVQIDETELLNLIG